MINFFQKPRERSTFLIITGGQGCGKTLGVEILIKAIGEVNSVRLDNLDELTGHFTAALFCKYLVYIPEMQSVNTLKNISQKMEQINKIITDKDLRIELKGKDSFRTENYFKVIGTTNNDTPIKIAADDRRNAILKCSNYRTGDRQYFDNLVKLIENPVAISHFVTYLLRIPANSLELVDVRNIPNTEEWANIIEHSKPNVVKFLDEFLSIQWQPYLGVNYEAIKNSEDVYINKEDLYQYYREWAKHSGFTMILDKGSLGSKLKTTPIPEYRPSKKNQENKNLGWRLTPTGPLREKRKMSDLEL